MPQPKSPIVFNRIHGICHFTHLALLLYLISNANGTWHTLPKMVFNITLLLTTLPDPRLAPPNIKGFINQHQCEVSLHFVLTFAINYLKLYQNLTISYLLLVMAYSPIKNDRYSLETVPKSKEVDLDEGSDTEIESAQADADESTPFVKRWPGVGILRLSRNQSRRRARDDQPTAPLINSLIPWVINLILAIALVSLSWKRGGLTTSGSHLPPTDLLWSKLPACTSGLFLIMLTQL